MTEYCIYSYNHDFIVHIKTFKKFETYASNHKLLTDVTNVSLPSWCATTGVCIDTIGTGATILTRATGTLVDI